MSKKPPVREMAYMKELRGKRLEIHIDPNNWVVTYNGNSPKYYSNIQAMCVGVQELAIRSLTKDLNPEKIRNIVIESEEYVADMANDIKRMFEKTPFATPERRHVEQELENIAKEERKHAPKRKK